VVELAGKIDRASVAQVTALTQVHPHHRVADVQDGGVYGIVRRGAAVRLDVRVLSAKERLGALDRQRFDPVDILGPAVIAFAWIPLGVLVVQQGAQRLQHRRARDVLGWNQLEGVLLPLEFVADRGTDLRIDGIDPACEVSSLFQHSLIIRNPGG